MASQLKRNDITTFAQHNQTVKIQNLLTLMCVVFEKKMLNVFVKTYITHNSERIGQSYVGK